MRVPARFYASKTLKQGFDEGVMNQLTNVACLPGIIDHALCMSDGHLGYGFLIGGVAAFSITEGVISPGGIGFDINYGIRLIRTHLLEKEVQPRLKHLLDALFKAVPAGVGGKMQCLSQKNMVHIMVSGAQWAIKKGYGWPHDRHCIEGEGEGEIAWADPEAVRNRAIERGIEQLGTLRTRPGYYI